MKQYYVYIMASGKRGYLYTGVTNNINRRCWEHKNKFVNSYSKKHNIVKLFYYEVFEDVNYAIQREKTIKKCRREIKFEAIEKLDPEWSDFYFNLND
ncbi:MAG: GIY-YIG nuclease family protein [Rickettsiales bacterium]|nr:GIY-YIG nuclease family protein [Rickettsiales bacterium]